MCMLYLWAVHIGHDGDLLVHFLQLVAHAFQVDEFDGYGAAGVVVEGFVHAAVPPLADLLDQLVTVPGVFPEVDHPPPVVAVAVPLTGPPCRGHGSGAVG